MSLHLARNYGFSGNFIPNTFIGGIAKQGGTGANAPIDTPYKLATKLGISVNRITGFRVIGDDVECRIIGSYSIPSYAFGNIGTGNSNTNITTFFDTEGNVSLLEQLCFYGTSIQQVNFPNATQINSRAFDNCSFLNEGLFPMVTKLVNQRTFAANVRMNNLYLPNLEEVEIGSQESRNFQQLGTNASSTLSILDIRKFKGVGNNPSVDRLIFFLIKSGITIRVHEDMATNNPIDLYHAKNTRGCTVELYDDNGDYVSTL